MSRKEKTAREPKEEKLSGAERRAMKKADKEMAKAAKKEDAADGPVAVRVQDGFSPCTMGYSIEAALSRPIDLMKLEPFAHSLGWVIEVDEENNTLQANYVTFYGDGSIVSKAFVKNDAQTNMDRAIQLIARAFNCVGCGLCAARCESKALYMENGKVRIHEDDCIFCCKCYGPCPAVNFAPEGEKGDKGFED